MEYLHVLTIKFANVAIEIRSVEQVHHRKSSVKAKFGNTGYLCNHSYLGNQIQNTEYTVR